MHRSKLFKLLIAFLALTIFATACGGSDDDSSSPDSSSASEATDSSSESSASEATEEQEVVVEEEEEEEVEEEVVEEEAIVAEEAEVTIEPVTGGTLRWGIEAESDGLNPTASALSASGRTMSYAIFDTIAKIDSDGNGVEWLAESWETNSDCTKWTITLRSGIQFHDGTPVNAEAVEYNFNAQLADPLVSLAVKYLFPTEGALDIIDDLTVRYNLLEPDCRYPSSLLTSQVGMVASPTWLQAALEDPTLDQQPVGSGPFRIDSRILDSQTTVVRNDNYWNGTPYLDAIEFVVITDSDIRGSLLQEGEIDGLVTTNVPTIVDLAEAEGINQFFEDTGDESFTMLQTGRAPFNDIRAREALFLATPNENYQSLINLGIPRTANQIFTPDEPYYNPDIVMVTDSPELAASLVEEYCADVPASCTNGKINMEYQYSGPSVAGERTAEVLIEGWKDFFNVTIDMKPQGIHIQEVAFGLFDAVGWRQFGYVNPTTDHTWLRCDTIGGLSLNWPRYCDEERDALLALAKLETEVEPQIEIYQEVSQRINDAFLYIFHSHSLWDVAVRDNVYNICGVTAPNGKELDCLINGDVWFNTTFIVED